MQFSAVKLPLVLVVCIIGNVPLFVDAQEESCVYSDGQPGVCRKVRDCFEAQQALQLGQRPVLCFYDRFTPVVCCPRKRGSTSTIAGTPGRPTGTAPASPSSPGTKPRPVTPTVTSLSERKCREYASAVYVLMRPETLQADDDWVNRSSCAIVETPLIVGGENAKKNEFPHMALLGYGVESNPSWFCGGSLISDQYVLTAAHCLSSREEGPVRWVRLGELEISNPNDGSEPQTIGVADRISHPDFRPPARYNDIALLRLVQPVRFTAHVRPACLQQTKELPAASNARLIATGWGRIGFSDDTSDRLLKVSLSIIIHDECSRAYRNEATTSKLRQGIDDKSMLCAGEPQGGKDTCQGDSGGPLQYVLQTPYCMYSIVGVTSFGKFCGFKNSPAVYTRVSNYVQWIESIVWA